MDALKDYYMQQGFDIGAKILTYIFEKIYDYALINMSKIKYQKILDFSTDFSGNFLKFIDSSIMSKKDFRNDTVFKKFDENKVKSIINEIFEKENIGKDIEEKIRVDLNEFNLTNKTHNINILLLSQEKIFMDKFFKIMTNILKIEKIKDNEYSFNVELKEYFKEIKRINIYYENFEPKKEINCVWYFTKNDSNIIEDKFIEEFLNQNIPIIYIREKGQINKDKLISLTDNNIENESILSYFNNGLIDINEINNQENNAIINLIDKSLFNILIKKYEVHITKETKEVLDKVLKMIKFDSGNNIDNIHILIGQFFKKIFSALLFKDKTVSNFTKFKSQDLLNKYKEYLKSYEESYFSEFLKKTGNDYIDIIKERINKRNIKLNQKQNLSDEEKEKMEMLDELDHFAIDFIEEIDINKKEKPKDDKKNENDFNTQLKIKFNDLFLEKASIYIIELVVLFIKENFIKYYKLSAIRRYLNISHDEKNFINEIKED